MRWLLVAGLLVGGCRQVFGIHDPALGDGGTGDDAPRDTIDGAPGANCFGSPIEICLDTAPLLPAMFGTTVTINTDQNPLCRPFTSPQGVTGCVIAGTSVALNGGTLHVTGSKPLIVVSTSTMTLVAGATVDVASHYGGSTGPAANAAACGSAVAPGNATTAGGGAGGSFGGQGGDGGHGGSGGTGGVAATASPSPGGLRGGCAGSNGAGITAGAGGAGGGALLLVADSIQIDGTIDASGAAGAGGTNPDGGGGGGGTGGLIVFEAASLTISGTAKVFASGAGGGEGSTSTQNGHPGSDPVSPDAAAMGGSGGTASAGDGGPGTFGNVLGGGVAGSGGGPNASGGGGGGGAGYILVHAPMQSIAQLALAPPVTP